MREKSKQLKYGQEDFMFDQVAIFFNQILGHDNQSNQLSINDSNSPNTSPTSQNPIKHQKTFWQLVNERMREKFDDGSVSIDNEQFRQSQAIELQASVNLHSILGRVQELTGVKLTKRSQKELSKFPETFRFVSAVSDTCQKPNQIKKEII